LSDRLRWPVFWALLAVFIFLVCLFVISAFNELLRGLWLLSPFAVFFALGVFFTLAILVCPLGFLVGAIGTIVIARKNKPSLPAATP